MIYPNGTGEIRGPDDYAKTGGAYGANRTKVVQKDGRFVAENYPHRGIDFVLGPRLPGLVPITGFVSRVGFAYPGDLRFHSVVILPKAGLGLPDGALVKILYLLPDRLLDLPYAVTQGERLGLAEDLSKRYGDPDGSGPRRSIVNHLHLEVRVRGVAIDPTPFFGEAAA